MFAVKREIGEIKMRILRRAANKALQYIAPSRYRPATRGLAQFHEFVNGLLHGQTPGAFAVPKDDSPTPSDKAVNPLETFFNSRSKGGTGVHKWLHFFEIYHRHFAKFRSKEVRVLEIGVQSGGSLDMWKDYFGPRCTVYGVDIDQRCKSFEDGSTKIFIGDQEDRGFWKRFKAEAPLLDIIIDDGGHTPEQQIVSLEELLPHLRPGGVYLCEDIYGDPSRFAMYVNGLTSSFHDGNWLPTSGFPTDMTHATVPNSLQTFIHSVHSYPYVIVIEKTDAPQKEFVVLKKGSQWLA